MLDDKTGKPTRYGAMEVLIAAHNNELQDAATKNFVAMISAALDTYPPEHVAFVEEHYVQLFNGIMAGWGDKWVRDVFAKARAIRGRA
jgi:hypothetical protein